ncbi:MAG: GyrI-like domain-containing protein [Desulfobacteraceae bacterium]|nr:GyrI-like domain-containing protein [Desulfobacteraceae bacterium]
MAKVDYKKDLKTLYKAPEDGFVFVQVPSLNYLMIEGMGDPSTSLLFQNSVEALYGIAYAVKFAAKAGRIGPEYTIAPLEGLWWCEGVGGFDAEHRHLWHWRLQIPQPPHVDDGMVRKAADGLEAKGKVGPFGSVRLENFEEGLCVQTLHVGPFSSEGPKIEEMHRFALESGYGLRGMHHEIYMSDHRRTPPEKLRTILRQPVEKTD